MDLFRRILIPVLIVLLTSVSGLAAIVKGVVTDETGEPIIGATVRLKSNLSTGTSTDIDGNYEINVPDAKSAVLVFSYVGMMPVEETVNGRTLVNVTMKENSEQLAEVVVVGYGQQKKASVVGAITQTSGETLARAGGVSSVGAALTGNLPGVVTESSTGMPGDEDPKIVIRGTSSWNSSSPLVLVDGIERPMSSVDISSVQSISVLKDASATAVYGVKGANGVVLITTKRGQEGRAQISAQMNMTMKVASKLPKKLGSADAIMIRNQAIERELGISPESWADIYPDEVIQKYRNPGDEWERYVDVDWENELFKRTAMSYNPAVNISGGTKSVKYFASVDFLSEGDLFREWDNGRGYKGGYGYNRVNARSNLDFQITRSTLFKVNLFGMHAQKKSPWDTPDNDYQATQLWQAAYSAPPDVFLPRYSDGTWGYYPKDSQAAPNSISNLATRGLEKTTTTRINTDFTLEQDLSFITPGLKVSGLISWDNAFVERHRGINDQNNGYQTKWINPLTGEVTYAKPDDSKTGFDFTEGVHWSTNGGEVDNYATQRNLFYQAQIYWANNFADKHDVSAMGVFNRTENTYGNDFTNYREDWAFRLTYNFDDRYFVEYNGAYNGSERFGVKHRFAFFNSGAVGWMISNEKFMSWARPALSSLKVRYSYGEVGDDYVPARWLYADQLGYGGQSFQGISNGTLSPYIWYFEKAMGNADVHWEKAIKQNLGIDYSFFNGEIGGNFEFFSEKRNDILVTGSDRAVPSYLGGSAPTANLGRVKTNGFELEIRLNHRFGDWYVWGNFAMTHAKNKILHYDDPALSPAYQKKTGFAIGQDHSYYSAGIAQTWDQVIGMTNHNTNDNQKLPGQFIIADYNADGVIDSNDSAPYSYTGSPENTYNATVGFEWKGFSAFVQFYGVTNVSRYVGFTSLANHLNTVYDEGSYWSGTNPGGNPLPRWSSTPNYYEGTRYHYDGSYVRLKNAEVAYTWTSGWVRKIGLNSLKLYLNGNNLWVWSRMPDDRESNFAGTGLASQGAYPTVRRFNLGVKFEL